MLQVYCTKDTFEEIAAMAQILGCDVVEVETDGMEGVWLVFDGGDLDFLYSTVEEHYPSFDVEWLS